jgi:hypothetical protein
VYTPERNRPNGMLVAIRGFQDKATYKGKPFDHIVMHVVSACSWYLASCRSTTAMCWQGKLQWACLSTAHMHLVT